MGKKKKAKKEKIPPKVPQTVAWTRPDLKQQNAEHYEIQVRDLERTLDSVQRRCDLLTVSLDDLEQSFEWRLREREDVHTYLKQLLYERERDLDVLRERYVALGQQSSDLQDEHDHVMGGLQEQFQQAQEELKAESVAQRARLQQLAEMFEARSALTQEFRQLRRAVHEQDETYWLRINQSEQNAIEETAEKKQQIFEYLTQLAGEFRKASRQAQSIHAREMLKQNITLSSDLRVVSDQTIIVATNNHKLSSRNKQLETDGSMYDEDYKLWQKRIKSFENVLERCTQTYQQLQHTIESKRQQFALATSDKLQTEASYNAACSTLQQLESENCDKRSRRDSITAQNEQIQCEIGKSTEIRRTCLVLLARASHALLQQSFSGDVHVATDDLVKISAALAAADSTKDGNAGCNINLAQALLDIVTYSAKLQQNNNVILYKEGDFEFVSNRKLHKDESASPSTSPRTIVSPVLQAEQRRLDRETNYV